MDNVLGKPGRPPWLLGKLWGIGCITGLELPANCCKIYCSCSLFYTKQYTVPTHCSTELFSPTYTSDIMQILSQQTLLLMFVFENCHLQTRLCCQLFFLPGTPSLSSLCHWLKRHLVLRVLPRNMFIFINAPSSLKLAPEIVAYTAFS